MQSLAVLSAAHEMVANVGKCHRAADSTILEGQDGVLVSATAGCSSC